MARIDGTCQMSSAMTDLIDPIVLLENQFAHQRFQDLLFTNAAQEAKRYATYVLIRVLQVVAQVLANLQAVQVVVNPKTST